MFDYPLVINDMGNLSIIPAADASRTLKQSVSKTLTGNNTTVSVPLWRVTGVVQVKKLYGIITTALGSNHTAAHFRLNDQTATDPITAAAGSDFSSYPAGGIMYVGEAVTDPLSGENSSTGNVIGSGMGLDQLFPFIVIKKDGANTDIEYRYSTTNTPTSGVIQFFIEYIPLSASGALTAQ